MNQIFYNGKIITMTEANAKETFAKAPEAVWVRDGLIVETGKYDDIVKIAGREVDKIDLEGKCLMPSFIDTHSHFVMNGQMSVLANLSECESFDDISAILKKYIEENNIEEDGVVLGYGYDHNFLKEGVHPNKAILDKVSCKIPIFIIHISAHLGCANSAALKLAQINEKTTDPQGGAIGRMEGSNEPNGYVEEAGMNLLQQAIMSKVKIEYSQMILKMQKIYSQNGVTTVQDGASTEREISALLNMSMSGALQLDVVAYPLMSANGIEIMEKHGHKYKEYWNRLKIGGYKLILDGSPQGRSAWMSMPYLGDDNDYCGYPWLQDVEVAKYLRHAVKEGKQVLAHCNGDAASEQFISIYEQVLKEFGNDNNLRPVMIHCQTVRNDQLERMALLKMVASIFVGHVWYWGDVHIRNFGLERGNRISPVKDAIERGVIVNFHQDTPVTKPDMLHSVWCAVNRISRGGNVIGKEQAINVYDALKAVTINAAYQYYEESTKGSIQKGKRADLVVLDQSPLEINKNDIKNIKVLETIKDGETIYRMSK